MSNHDHDVQTTFAKRELEKLGRPMPMDYNNDHLNLPVLEVPPSNYLYRELLSEAAKVDAIRQRHGIHGAIVDGTTRYYVPRTWARSSK